MYPASPRIERHKNIAQRENTMRSSGRSNISEGTERMRDKSGGNQ